MQKFLRSHWLTTENAERIRQAVETGITGVTCMYVARWLQLPEWYWAVISALIVRQGNPGDTFGASWTRITGTAIGALVGGAFANLWGSEPWAFGIAVSAAVLACAALKLTASYRLSSVTVAIVMLINHSNVSPWKIALHRFVEVALGIVVAVLLTLVFDWISTKPASNIPAK